MSHYLAFVFPERDGYGFTAPDVPGFTAFAATRDFDAAAAEARRVLTDHLAALVDTGGALPSARDIEALRADPALADDFAEAATTVMLPALLPYGRTVRVNLSLDQSTLGMIDLAAEARGLTRSAFVAEAARRLVDAEG